MASDRRRGRREQAAEEDVPVAEIAPAHEEGRGKEKPAKKSAAGFPGVLPVAAGIAAAALAAGGVFLTADKVAAADPYESLDAGGVQAARLMGSMPIEMWQPGYGSVAGFRKDAEKQIEAKKSEALKGDDKEFPQMEEAIRNWLVGDSSAGTKWRPGFNLLFPRKQGEDEIARQARDEAIFKVEEKEPAGFIGAMVLDAKGQGLIAYPDKTLPPEPPGDKRPVKVVGETQVFATTVSGKSARWYQQPMRNRTGSPEGACVVVISTASVKPVSVIPLAGAAAGLAFLGGLLSVLILTGGTKNALAHLAHDTEAVARGHLDAKITVAGPVVVQQIAKGVQKIAALAHSGAAAPPQVMVQEVVRAPVKEISEALAPSRTFQRPDEFEVEATQKLSAEVGNDYYDVVNVDDEHVGVLIADIPQRGVKSSMHMASIRTLFRAHCKGQPSPAEVLKAVNRAFAVELPRGVYVTAMYVVVNRTSGVCKVANAQHLPLVFWKLAKKASARLSPEGIALGLDTGAVFDKTISEKAIQLDKGDRIVLYTDGAMNGRNPAGAQYGDERFYYVVNREAPKNSAACVNFVANDVDLFHEGAPLTDDFTIVTLRRLK
jgi:serine phosphatase RsbU (regulator of sigma subunit)